MRSRRTEANMRPRPWSLHGRLSVLAVVVLGVALLGLWALAPEALLPRLDDTSVKTGVSRTTAFVLHASPRAARDIVFQDASGATRHLADFRGRVILLNLWATWCAPCREEMPTLDRLQIRLGGKDFEVLALSIDRDGASVVKRFFDDTNVRALALYVDPTTEAQGTLGAIGIPTTVLINREGREVARKTGPAVWDAPAAVAVIEPYLTAASH